MQDRSYKSCVVSITHVFPSFAIGGQQRRLATLIDGLGDNFHHSIIALDGDLSAGDLIDNRAAFTARAMITRKSRGVSIGNLREIRFALAGSRADLLCTYNWGAMEAVAANRTGSRLAHLHFEDGFGADEASGRQHWRRVLIRRLLLSGTYVAVPSPGLELIARDVWRIRADRILRLPIGIDLARFASPRGPPREGAIVVGSIGALRAEKNYPRLVEAFAHAARGTDARLVIHGDGPERSAIEKAIAKSGVGDRISLPGRTMAPEKVLNAIDIFAISSDTEQTPISLMEAMASGLALAATDVGEIRAMLSAENGSRLSPVADDAGFASQLRALIQDSGLRRRLGAANFAKAKSAFGDGAMIEAHRRLFLSLAGR